MRSAARHTLLAAAAAAAASSSSSRCGAFAPATTFPAATPATLSGVRRRRRKAAAAAVESSPTSGSSPAAKDGDFPMSVEDLSRLTVAELKHRLRGLNLAVGGRKAVLVARLVDHDAPPAERRQPQREREGGAKEEEETSPEPLGSEKGGTKDKCDDGLGGLTVLELRERLRGMGLRVGGRKAELVGRLREAYGTTVADEEEKSSSCDDNEKKEDNVERDHLTRESTLASQEEAVHAGESVDEDASSGVVAGDRGDESVLIDILDEILDDGDDPKGDGRGDRSAAGETTRRAKRKKYWKTREVRDLVEAGDPRAARAAEDMIASLEAIAREEEDDAYLPGPAQYTVLVEAYARDGAPDSVRRAEAVLDRCIGSADGIGAGAGATARMVNAVMTAHAEVGTAEAAGRASALLERMEYLRQFGGGGSSSEIRPTAHSYSIAISAWARCDSGEAAENAEVILERMVEAHEGEVREGGGASSLARPNTVVFNGVIDAWARSGVPDAGERAEAILRRMEGLAARTDDYDVRPDTISFNACIKVWCNKDTPFKAEELLAKLETHPQYPKRNGGVLTVRPNRLSYNTVINAWARSPLSESAMRAEGILLRMIKSFKSDAFSTVTPDAVTFSSVLNALAKSKTVRFKAEKCSSILKAMSELHEDDGSYDTRPNAICFNTCLNACAFSAYASVEERHRALAVAVETINQMRRGRNGMASRLFASCCDEGLVGGMCLDEIRRCLPPRAFLPLLADCGYDEPVRQRQKAHSVKLHDLPRTWTANVKRGDMASRQRGSFVRLGRKGERRGKEGAGSGRRNRYKEKMRPVVRRPGLVVEYGASAKDM